MSRTRQDYVTKELEVEIGDSERLSMSHEAAELTHQIEDLELESKRVAKRYKNEIGGKTERRSFLMDSIRTGRIVRDVRCVVYFDWDTGLCEILREDTYEVVHSRPLTEHEKQGRLFPETPEEPDEPDDVDGLDDDAPEQPEA